MHILFTRPLEDCQDMMIQFKLLGHEVSHMPVISIEKKIIQKLIIMTIKE